MPPGRKVRGTGSVYLPGGQKYGIMLMKPSAMIGGSIRADNTAGGTRPSVWADGASGTGTDNSVECQPNCAMGPRLFNPIVVRAWNPKTVEGCPPELQFYSDLTVAYPQGVPPWVKPGTQWAPDTYFTTVDGMPAVHFINQGAYSCTPLDR